MSSRLYLLFEARGVCGDSECGGYICIMQGPKLHLESEFTFAESIICLKTNQTSNLIGNVSGCAKRWPRRPTGSRPKCENVVNPHPNHPVPASYADASQSALKSALQGIAIFLFAQFAVNQFVGNKKSTSGNSSTPNTPTAVPSYDARADSSTIESYSAIPRNIAPIWPLNSTVDLAIYVSPSFAIPNLKSLNQETLVLEEKGFAVGDWKENRQIDTSFGLPKEVQSNGTLWAHIYVGLQGHVLDPADKNYDLTKAYHFSQPLNHIIPKKKVKKTKNLLSGSKDGEEPQEVVEEDAGPTFASYYHPNFTMAFIPDSGTLSYTSLHPAIRQYVQLESTGARDASGQNGWYYPILFVNTFWQLKDHMTELNSTVKTLPIHITLNNLANWKFNLYASIDDNVKQNQKKAATGGGTPAAGDGSEFEMFKAILVDTNIYLLGTTAFVSVLHMIFEMLAFKSDIVSYCDPT